MYEDSYLDDVSRDGRYFCVYSTPRPVLSYLLRNGGVKSLNPKTRERDAGLKVIEFGTWNVICTKKLRLLPVHATFFADSERVFVDTASGRSGDGVFVQLALIDTKTGGISERTDEILKVGRPIPPDAYLYSYRALFGNTLLGHQQTYTTCHHVSLFHATWPDLTVTRRVPYSPRKVPLACGEEFTAAWITLSADRRFVAHPDGWNVIYRRTEDLEILWRRSMSTKWSIENLAVSSDGSMVAVAVGSRVNGKSPPDSHVAVLDGRDGSELMRVMVSGSDGVAVSPSRKLLVVGRAVELDSATSDTESNLQLFDLDSGKHIETLTHYRRRIPRGAADPGGYGPQGIRFTPDGKYMVSATQTHTKVWKLR
jgi:DNA-binding beta-propeller fold protein YncE